MTAGGEVYMYIYISTNCKSRNRGELAMCCDADATHTAEFRRNKAALGARRSGKSNNDTLHIENLHPTHSLTHSLWYILLPRNYDFAALLSIYTTRQKQ